MTVRVPQMSVAEFEELAGAAYRIAEGLRLELIEGRLSAKPPPDGNHGCITAWLIRLCLLHRPELWLSSAQGLIVGDDRMGRARPDGALAHAEAFVGQGEWADPSPVLLVVEVASRDENTDRRDKPHAYAEVGIPIYLLIARNSGQVTAHSEPDAGRYTCVMTVEFGAKLQLPEPVGITLDTEPLKRWAA